MSPPYTSLKFTHQGKDYFVIHRSTSPPKFTRFGSQDLDGVFRGKIDKKAADTLPFYLLPLQYVDLSRAFLPQFVGALYKAEPV